MDAAFRFDDKMNFDFHAAPRAHAALTTTLHAIEAAQLIRRADEIEPTFIFKHALVQDSAGASLLKSESKRLHLLVAQAYEEIFADRCMDEYAARLAQHFAEAGDDANTLLYALHAGDLAASAYANAEAIAFYALALEAAQRSGATTAQLIHLYTKRGRVYEVTGRDVEALATYEEMMEYARARGDPALKLQSLLLRGKLHAAPSPAFSRAETLALAEEATTLAVELGDRAAQAYALWIQQLAYVYNSEIPDAIRCGEQALAIAREANSRELLGYILTDLARAYLQAGRIDKLTPLEAEARAIWRELDNKPMLADNLMQTATQTMLRGELDETLALTQEGIEISQAIGSKLSLMSNQGTQLGVYLERGEYARALHLSQAILRESTTIEGTFNAPINDAIAAWIYAQLGALERAAELANEARTHLGLPIAEFFRAWTWVMLARYQLAIGNFEEARAALAASGMEHHSARIDPAGMYGMVVLGECLLAEGEYARVIELLSKRVHLLRQFGLRAMLTELLLLQAKAARAAGKLAQAFEFLQQARVEAEALQARRLLWQIYALLSEMENERGNVAPANAYREQARDILKFIIAHTPEEFRASFLNLPRVREVMA